MSNRQTITIADITLSTETGERDMRLGLRGAASRFHAKGTAPDVRIRAAWGEPANELADGKVFDLGAAWQLFRRNGTYLFRFVSPGFGPRPYKEASFGADFATGQVSLRRACYPANGPVDPLDYPLDELLMVNLLAAGRGVEVHGCGLVDANGNGHLFVGHSGAGKTTMAPLWQRGNDANIFSDDRVILRGKHGRFQVYGTPWHGDPGLASPERAPLAGVYLLHHGHRNELQPQPPAEAAARLLACSFVPYYNPEALDFTLGFLDELAQGVPCFRLWFRPDERIVDFIQEHTVRT